MSPDDVESEMESQKSGEQSLRVRVCRACHQVHHRVNMCAFWMRRGRFGVKRDLGAYYGVVHPFPILNKATPLTWGMRS